MFADNFEKLADKEPKEDWRPVKALASGVAGAGGAAAMASGLRKYLHGSAGNEKLNNKLISSVNKHLGVNVHHNSSHPISNHNALYIDKPMFKHLQKNKQLADLVPDSKSKAEGLIITGKRANPGITAHELGHAQHFQKMNKHLRKIAPFTRGGGSLAGLAVGGALLSSDDQDKRKYAPAAVLAGQVPTLYQEARASLHGHKNLKKYLGKAEARKAIKPMLRGFGSYGAMAAGLTGAAHFMSKKKED